MKTIHKFVSTSTLLVWISVLFVPGMLSAVNVNKILKQMQKKYRSTKSIRIDFKEISRFQLTGTQSEIFGTLLMEGKNRFRLETEDQVLVNDGKTLWRFNKLENQVLIDYAKTEQQDVLLNDFLYNLQDRYYGELIREIKDKKTKRYILKLVPKPSEQSFFTAIKLWVKDKTWEIERVIYTDYNNNETEFVVESIEFNPHFTAETFTFTPPDGTQVIDLRF